VGETKKVSKIFWILVCGNTGNRWKKNGEKEQWLEKCEGKKKGQGGSQNDCFKPICMQSKCEGGERDWANTDKGESNGRVHPNVARTQNTKRKERGKIKSR